MSVWTHEDDVKIRNHVEKFGLVHWAELSANMGRGRCGKSVRYRWLKVLDPSINHGPWTEDEDKRLIELFAKSNGSWVIMSHSLPGRTDVQIRARWNCISRKRNNAALTASIEGMNQDLFSSIFPDENVVCTSPGNKKRKTVQAVERSKPASPALRPFGDSTIKFKMTFGTLQGTIAKRVAFPVTCFKALNSTLATQMDARKQKWDGLGKL